MHLRNLCNRAYMPLLIALLMLSSERVSGESSIIKLTDCNFPLLNLSMSGNCTALVKPHGDNHVIQLFPTEDPLICRPGLLMPIMVAEDVLSPHTRAVVYVLFLMFLFLGIAIIADIFMASIEVITSKEKTISYENSEGVTMTQTYLVWNETVANLTLMALGSSAPEILLAVIETCSALGEPPSADGLGASTIVGSAAFNLLVISAVCVVSIPNGEVKRIKGMGVFMITAFFSIFAYFWLYFVLVIETPDIVDLWEALVTLALFPLLVALSYFMDAQPWKKSKTIRPSQHQSIMARLSSTGVRMMTGSSHLGRSVITQLVKRGKKSKPQNGARRQSLVPEDLAAELVQMAYNNQKKSHLHYRINAIRILKGGRRVIPNAMSNSEKTDSEIIKEQASSLEKTPVQEVKFVEPVSVMSFSSPAYQTLETSTHVNLHIHRDQADTPAEVEYETGNGTAKAGLHYKYSAGTIRFDVGQEAKTVRIPLIYEESMKDRLKRFFVVRLQNYGKDAIAGDTTATMVTIVNCDAPGVFEFTKKEVSVTENVGTMKLEVIRKDGCKGAAAIKWRASSDNPEISQRQKALPGEDFLPEDGTLVFLDGETKKSITLTISDDDQAEADALFEVKIFPDDSVDDVKPAVIGDLSSCSVTIIDDDEVTNMVDKVYKLLDKNMDRMKVSTSSWKVQFRDSMFVSGDDDDNPAFLDYLMHFLTFFWKVLFAFVPPTEYCGGWLTFIVSLIFIGVLTMFVGDAANTFGCAIGLPNSITAITFVALGTSLPDLFASMTAARQDDSADASIGNVTGSNSVNVFLGLGLPWTIAAVYNRMNGEIYYVYGGKLGFSVAVFVSMAVVCLSLLVIRRASFVAGGELGGPKGLKIFTFMLLVSLWIVYVTLSSLNDLDML